jgi:hypothetical protein
MKRIGYKKSLPREAIYPISADYIADRLLLSRACFPF